MIRDELATVLFQAVEAWAQSNDSPGPYEAAADAVLAYLGRMDPDCDPELIALHLRDSRTEIAGLREALRQIRAIHAPAEHDECGECELLWPCATAALAGFAETGREQT